MMDSTITVRLAPGCESLHTRLEKAGFDLVIGENVAAAAEDGAEIVISRDRPQEKKRGTEDFCRTVYLAAGETELDEAVRSGADDVWCESWPDSLICFRLKALKRELDTAIAGERSRVWLETLINSVPELIWFKDISGAHLEVNESLARLAGRSRQELRGRDHCYIWNISPEEYQRGQYVCLESDEAVMSSRKGLSCEEVVKVGESLRKFVTYKAPLIDSRGVLRGTVGMAHDITELQNMTVAQELLISSLPGGVVVVNADGLITTVNDRLLDMTGWSRESLIGQEYGAWRARLWERYAASDSENEIVISPPGMKTPVTLELSQSAVLDVFGKPSGAMCFFTDVTDVRRFEQEIINRSNTDYMTGLYNRRYLYESLQKRRPGGRLNIAFVDVDDLKGVNDTYGHPAGDRAIRAVAAALTRALPEARCFRMGGDEFLLAFFGEADEDFIRQRIIEFRRALEEESPDMPLSVSAGIACEDDEPMDIDILLRHGDAALYEVKRDKKKCCCVYDNKTGKCSPVLVTVN